MNLAEMESSVDDHHANLLATMTFDEIRQDISPSKPTKVDIRLSIALAVPTDSSTASDFPIMPGPHQITRRISESVKAQGYYRIEYSLFPEGPATGFDIVVFRTAAKIYPDNQDSQIVLTWEQENENVWIVWEQIHELELERDRLLTLLSHKILFKIWDGKEFCLARTKLDKPRIGRALSALHQAKDQMKMPRTVVEQIVQNFADKWVAKPMLYHLKRKLPIEIPEPSASLQKKIDKIQLSRSQTPISLRETPVKSGEIAGDQIQISTNATAQTPEGFRDSSPDLFKSILNGDAEKSTVKKKRRTGPRIHKLTEEKREKGSAQIVIPCKLIFAGFKMITSRLDDDADLPRTIQDCFISLTIDDHSLFKETLAKEFNPMSINISYVENMPSKPIPFSELKQKCEPVYCSYQMFDQPVHQTDRKSHASDIYWNDVNLYLINLLSDTQLGEFRNSPILNVELHDRDEKASSRRDFASVFGTEQTDDSIARVSGKINLLKTKTEPDWHPHGCVRLDLSELWLGQTSIEFYVPVVPCHANEPASGRARSAKRSTHGTKHFPIQQGDFLASGTQMKVLVRLAQPLSKSIEQRLTVQNVVLSSPSTIPPFTRIVFIFPCKNTKFLTSLETCVRTINATALDFQDQPPHRQVAALSTFKLTEAQQNSHTLNIVTGFHLFDEEHHLFVLEGRKEDAIDVIYQKLPKPEGQNIEILYDSSILFSERLYAKLGLDITHVKLSKNLRDIISQPLIFVRENLAKDTFDALDKLNQLIHVGKLSVSTRHNLFPTIEMIISLTRDFGVPLTEKEIKLFSMDDRSTSASTHQTASDNRQPEIIQENPTETTDTMSKQETKTEKMNFVQKNIEQIHSSSLKNRDIQQNDSTNYFMTVGPIYPYSTQKLNASENALEQMRNYLKQHHRSSSCSFHPDHRSGTFSPYSNEETVMDYHQKLRTPLSSYPSKSKENLAEKVTTDWINTPGYRTSLQSNNHPRSPDPARIEELSKPPEELYEQKSSRSPSPTSIREPFRWIQRKEDFDRWTRPPTIPANISAHWKSNSESNRSSSSLSSNSAAPANVVADDRMYFLRRSGQTEMTTSGRLSASQLDRLTGLLKDKPVKKGLLLPKSYARKTGSQSAPLMRHRSSTNTPDRRFYSRTSTSRSSSSFRKNV